MEVGRDKILIRISGGGMGNKVLPKHRFMDTVKGTWWGCWQAVWGGAEMEMIPASMQLQNSITTLMRASLRKNYNVFLAF